MSSSNLSDQLRGVADLVEEIESSDDIDAEVHDARLDGVAVDNTQFRATLTVLSPIDADETVVLETDDQPTAADSLGPSLKERVIDILKEHGELPAKEIQFLLESSTDQHYEALAELQNDGQVVSRKDPEDGRRKLYRLAGHDIEEADESSDAGDENTEDDDTTDEEVECDICGFTAANDRGLAIHQARAHNDEDENDDEDQPDVETPTADELRALREDRDWTQADLGSEIGVAASTVGNWEADNSRTPGAELSKEIQKLLNESDTSDADDDAVEEPEAEASNEENEGVESDDGSIDDEDAENADDDDDGWFPRECHCGDTLENSLKLAVHRTEKHEVPQSQLNHLDPGEFEEIAAASDSALDLADELGFSQKKTMTLLGIYGLNEFDVDTSGGNDVDVEDDSHDEIDEDPEEEATEQVDTAAVDLQDYGVGRRELVDALEGSQTIHHVQRELGITRGETRELLDELGMLDRISSGCAPLSIDDAKDAVRGVA